MSLAIASPQLAHAACSGVTDTWTAGGNSNWTTAASWSTGVAPTTSGYDAVIVSASRIPNMATVSIGCLDIQSGTLAAAAATMTINGYWFNNPFAGSITSASTTAWNVTMAGTGTQYFNNQDSINNLTISNNTTVNSGYAFTVRNILSFTGSGTTFNINANLTLSLTTSALTIPSGVTVVVGSGATLTAQGGITVNGTLTINPGGSVVIGSGKTLQVNSGGALNLSGASGNVATLDGAASATYSITAVTGSTVSGSYFRISHTTANGLNVAGGTISSLSNGEFHYIAPTGQAITLNNAASTPSTMDSIGFYNDAGNATAYNVSVPATYTGNSMTFTNWSNLGGVAHEQSDPNGKVSWGTQAPTRLTLQNNTAVGFPASTVGASAGPSLFATFAFGLTQTDTATDVTSIKITMNGTASASDIDYIQVFADANGDCAYTAATDTTQLGGGNLVMVGNPPTATVSGIPTNTVRTSGQTPACIHVLAKTSATAANGKTISFQIAATSDVSNTIVGGSTSYSFSVSSGPPVGAAASTISTTAPAVWDGSHSTSWATPNNWSPATTVTTTTDCTVATGSSVPIPTSPTSSCQNMNLASGGTINFNSATVEMDAYGTLTVASGYVFQNSASATLAMKSSTSHQSLNIATWPQGLIIANTAAAPENYVSVDGVSAISGSLSLNSGILKIPAGMSLTVGGNVTVASGATLEIMPGGSLILGGNPSTVTVNTGGTLKMVGTASQTSTMTSYSNSTSYTVAVSGTIQAQYYAFTHLGSTGVTINNGATIDSTYHMQNGTFGYPAVTGATLLRLFKKVPPGDGTETLSNMAFNSSSSGNGAYNIYVDSAATAGTGLTVSTYSGDLAGPSLQNPSNYTGYPLVWTGASNTIDVTRETSAPTPPTSVLQGSTYSMERFGFKQTLGGASYTDAYLTSLTLTMNGTATASDVSAVRAYYDASCTGSGGTQVASGTLSGSPAAVTFTWSGTAGPKIPASTGTPSKVCIYVQYDIASNAVNANTAGVKIAGSTDIATNNGYTMNGSPPAADTPATIVGSSTTWTGTAGTGWFTSGNWNGGVPTSSLNCIISNVTNKPVIAAAGAVCKSVTLNGALTINSGQNLDVYGSFTNNVSGTTNNGTITIRDDGTNSSNQVITSVSSLGGTLIVNKTAAGGTVSIAGTTLTLAALTFNSGSVFTFNVPSGQTLTVTGATTISGGTLDVNPSGTANLQGGTTLNTSISSIVTVENGGVAAITGLTASTGAFNVQSGSAVVNLYGTITGSGAVFSLQGPGTTFNTTPTFSAGTVTHSVATYAQGVTISGGTFTVAQGENTYISAGKTLSMTSGTFTVTGTNDAFASAPSGAPAASGGQNLTTKGLIGVSGSGNWTFSASGGTVDLTGFIIDSLDTNGLNLSGSANLTNLNGGQFTHLPAGVKAIQLNTSAAINITANNVGWMWGAANGIYNSPPSPLPTDVYYLVYAPNCGSGTINFSAWFGDFYQTIGQPTAQNKVFTTACTVTISSANSAVDLASLSAAGYDTAVAVDWTTASETNHAGFNVYRSDPSGGGYVQVNPALIRNAQSATASRGNYRFVDQNVVNDQSYLYYVEDVEYGGARTLHGPVGATPTAAAGPVPSAASGTNSGTSAGGAGSGNAPATTGPIADGGLVDLGNGVHILAQSTHSMRLEIVPPSASFATSSWNSGYQSISIPGYSSTLDAGKPEIVERTVLVEVDPTLSAVTVASSNVTELAPQTHQLQPAPSWAPSGGTGPLVPTYSPDAMAYASTSYSPATYFTVAPLTQRIGTHNFVSVKVDPALYRASDQQVKLAARIVIDIGLDQGAWNGERPPVSGTSVAPASTEDTLRIRYRASGLYQVFYDDLVNTAVDGPFAGADTSQFRLYFHGAEIPVEIITATGSFSPGDAIRFYGPFAPSREDSEDEVVLAKVALDGSTLPPQRIPHLNANPAGAPASTQLDTSRHATSEQDLYPMFDSPLGDDEDHLYWIRLERDKGKPANFWDSQGVYSSLAIPIDLPALRRDSSEPVHLHLRLKGGAGYSQNATHHIQIFVNTVPFQVGDAVITTQDPTTIDFDVPAAYFVDGTNTVKVQVLGDLVQDGDSDILYIDKLDADFRASFTAMQGVAEIFNYQLDTAVTVNGFSNPISILVYDISDLGYIRALDAPPPASPDGGLTYSVSFKALSDPSGHAGTHLIVSDPGSLLSPSSMKLGRGDSVSLHATANGADLIVIGPEAMLLASSDLIAARRAQGLRVVAVTLDQIYAEFSNGLRSSQSIRDFVQYALANWTDPAPRYVLFVGDASYDPRDRLGLGQSPDIAPLPLVKGTFSDFGGDDWFAAPAGSALPSLAVGRIPADNAADLQGSISKILAYESGARSPTSSTANQLFFVSDRDVDGEGFASLASGLASSATAARSSFSTSQLSRSAAPDDAAVQTGIVSAFNSGPLTINYVGHGAEDRWANLASDNTSPLFGNADATALSNPRLPIVLGLNCLNARYYDPDPTFATLGEKMIFNPNGGSVAFLGSTTLTSPAAQLRLARAFYDQLGQETSRPAHDVRIGDLILRAKAAVGTGPAMLDTVRSYVLLGDPSTRLPDAAFIAAPPAPGTPPAAPATQPPAPSSQGSNDDSHHGGFFSCGTIDPGNGHGPGNGSGSGGAAAESALLLLLMAASRRLTRVSARRQTR